MSKPKAVLISDLHFTPSTLHLAAESLFKAATQAHRLSVPLIVAGDTLDTKAIIRGECANRLLEIVGTAEFWLERVYFLVGNHDLLNEKSKEHSLNFLKPYASVVQSPVQEPRTGFWMVPYMGSGEELETWLKTVPSPGSTLIMHTGVQSAYMGHYTQDKSSLPKAAFADFRVISGHYHASQDIKCGRPRKGAVGLFSYIGNPYTLNFGEAKDPAKGFCILHSNGMLERIPMNLRKHTILEISADEYAKYSADGRNSHFGGSGDIVWVKISGTRSQLDSMKKDEIGRRVVGHSDFKLDLIYTDTAPVEMKTEKMTGAEILDSVIDAENESNDEKQYLKDLWRELV